MAWRVAGYETDADKPFDQGSFGTVWHARRLSDGQRVALKLVRRDRAVDAAERIEAERRGAMLQRSFHDAHGMVPAVYDVWFDADGDLLIAMELIAGGSLADAMGGGPLDPRVAAGHAAAICTFLEKAHSFSTTIEGDHYDRLVHADLKPGHIFRRDGDGVIVLDFGIAKALDKATPLTTNNWGTSAYMSPERLLDGRVDEQVDFWSLGVMLYEMLAGHRPYRTLQAPGFKSHLERAIRGNEPREPLPPSVPPGLVAIVNKLLAYQPERRYPSAAPIRADLLTCLDGGRPTALDAYDTPATMRVGEETERRPVAPPRSHGNGEPTPAIVPPLPLAAPVPPTDPLPFVPPPLPIADRAPLEAGAASAAVDRSPTEGPAAARRRQRLARAVRAAGRRSRRSRLLWVASMLFLLYLGSSEAAGWFEAGQFRAVLGTIDGPALPIAEASYDRIASTAMFDLGLRLRVNRPLRRHLAAMAERVVEDYRHDQPSLTLAHWKQAQQALRWANRLGDESDTTLSRLQICEAHILRISIKQGRSAAGQASYRRAIDRFRAAARLDPQSYDGYLGISRVAVYGLSPADVDLAAEAIKQAEQRGYRPGRRERAQLGDGYMRRAETVRREARTLSGEERLHALQKARQDYRGCIESFEPIVGFANAARNIETCKADLEELEAELDEHEPASVVPEGH